ncbi:hypothetical protein FVE85_1892 [Porphyridium purpureum]|uniref:Uncharacterized protein n=1 Tax=Porphyridium purpureum TaxID=35688 RepID=A0A5J4YZ52_PORPP|nr:hypothetical protein FVE85_1892 [Porphyridium purpureum]|eukprot:POR9800..scf209_3
MAHDVRHSAKKSTTVEVLAWTHIGALSTGHIRHRNVASFCSCASGFARSRCSSVHLYSAYSEQVSGRTSSSLLRELEERAQEPLQLEQIQRLRNVAVGLKTEPNVERFVHMLHVFLERIKAERQREEAKPRENEIALVLLLKALAEGNRRLAAQEFTASGQALLSALTQSRFLSLWQDAFHDLLPTCTARSLSSIMHSFGILAHSPQGSSFGNALVATMELKLVSFDSVAIALCLHSFACLAWNPGTSFMQKWSLRAREFMASSYSSRSLAQMMSAFTRPRFEFSAVEIEFVVHAWRTRLQESSDEVPMAPGDICILLHSLAKLHDTKLHDHASFSAVADLAMQRLCQPYPGEEGTSPMPMTPAPTKARCMLDEASAKDLVLSLWAFERLRVPVSLRFMNFWENGICSETLANHLTIRDLSMIAVTFARLPKQPSQKLSLLLTEKLLALEPRDLLSRAEVSAADSPYQAVCNTVWAFAYLDPFRSASWRATSRDEAERLHTRLVRQLCNLYSKISTSTFCSPNAREDVMFLWALAKLCTKQHKQTSSDNQNDGVGGQRLFEMGFSSWMQRFCQLPPQSQTGYGPWQLSVCMYALAKSKMIDQMDTTAMRIFYRQWMRCWRKDMHAADFHSITLALWSLASMRRLSRAFFSRAAALLLFRVRELDEMDPERVGLSPQQVGFFLWSCARAYTPSVFEKLTEDDAVKEAVRSTIMIFTEHVKMRRVRACELAMSVWALGKLRYSPAVCDELVQAVVELMGDEACTSFAWDGQSWTVVTWWFSRIDVFVLRDNSALRSKWMDDRFSLVSRSLTVRQLGMIIWSLGRTDVPYGRNFAALYCMALQEAIKKRDRDPRHEPVLELDLLRKVLTWTKVYFFGSLINAERLGGSGLPAPAADDQWLDADHKHSSLSIQQQFNALMDTIQ